MGPLPIEVILFDLGGVLIELAGVEMMMKWSPAIANTDELWRRWLHSDAVRRFETGTTSRLEIANALVAEFAVPVSPDEFLTAFNGWPRSLYPGTFELLATMRKRFRLASVTNTNEIHWERFANAWSLPASFDHNFPSHLVGKLKPDAEYFTHVLDAVATRPERVLFIDDNAINVDAAARLGIVARRVAGVDGARRTFRELGLLEK